ncbi:TetR/AcrR family transcriptional regulator [Bifidobacterium sp. ESL0775]|uniref:TetR/AcrR family transcriptional regulator n=1 Tax=Bifidobacterium sp. ESL0775 TaxID=2983230 RepID=UPI0023F81A72|nr:TetR/AcrR family transcriptional regulator [Bifidobacterium sp. ESL0775]WEV69315.1 TetR/AcrR family transcriptional regulator [Bifidobacterium sp. ESL0775]
MPRINEANLEEHRRHTMNALLDSAEKIMREQGGDALTPANVSKGAGIARNSIYRYVKDMKDLRRQLMARHMPKWIDALEEGLGGVTDPAEIVVQWVRINLEQSVLQGHDWMTQIPLSDAQTYRDDKVLWPKPENTASDGDKADDTSPNDQPLEPTQPSLHERVNAPIVAAWGKLCPENPQVGIALTEGLVSSGMRLLSGKEQTEGTRTVAINDIERASRAIVGELREDE